MGRTAPNFKDITAQRFGRLTAIAVAEKKNGKTMWRCKCDCGGGATVLLCNLTAGRQKSCGCLNNEKRAERNAALRTTDEHKQAASRVRALRWARANKEKSRQWYESAKCSPDKWERMLESARRWARENPEHKKALTRNRRAKLRDAEGSHSKADIMAVREAQRGRCAICGTSKLKGFHVDHITPISKGGTNDKKNLQILCSPCNLKKWAYDPLDYMRSLGRLL